MANEISFNFALTGFKSTVMSQPDFMAVTSTATMTGNNHIHSTVALSTSPTLIPLGGVVTPRYAFFYNTDLTNYFTLRNGSGGADLAQYYAGDKWPLLLYGSVVLYGVANTASVLVEYLIFSA